MESAVKTFVFDADEEPRPLRMVLRDGEPWFVAKDVCAALGVRDTSQAVEPLDDDEKGTCLTRTLGGEQEMLIVSESGLYTLILRSRQATTAGTLAHRFRRWVTGEVIPSIRRTGQYAPDPAAETPLHEINTKARLVEIAIKLGGKAAGRALWRDLGLPDVPELGGPADRVARPGTALSGLDFVRQFLADCTVEEPGAHAQASYVYRAYQQWAQRSEAPPMTLTAFGMCINALGVAKQRARAGSGTGSHVVVYDGIRLKHPSEML